MIPAFHDSSSVPKIMKCRDLLYIIILIPGQSSDCYDVYKLGLPLPEVYDLKSLGSVQCLEGGWTSIQHRGQYGNPKDYFSKNWIEYAQGFGSPGKNESKAEEALGTIP